MTPREVKTIAKDRTLTDQVLESPVDSYEARFRLIVGIALIVIVVALMLF